MYTLRAENEYGQILELTYNPAYGVKSVIGFDPPDGVINTTRNAGQDGSVFNSAYMDNRTITITLALNYPAEQNRIQLYTYFKIKKLVTLRFTNGARDVKISGYVQSMQVAYFDKKETVQITVLCPKPYLLSWESINEDLSSILALFEFPFSIETPVEMSAIEVGVQKSLLNEGDVETGMICRINAYGAVSNPQIYDTETQEHMRLLTDMISGDLIEICTIPGQKYIRRTRNGTTASLISALSPDSIWMMLRPGDNVISTAADSGAEYMQVSFDYTYQYEGV